MSEFWSKIGNKLMNFLVWAIDNHPGKFIGTAIGSLVGLLFVTLGFWQTLVLVLFATVGFIIGKRQDDHKDISTWLERILNKY
ncbi:MAG: membrane protein [Peptococcaceae bacterium BRH_c23]|nr:DUF2273 domain-containing protein [Desulfosporosinus sp. BICA1-9]KJS49816.1 MAG: membrane protein [Peptococcaceae bacterium BRH_c23]KJS78791.1 MAG: membrane protein [Desulfosporosinus sp. BICA1-9]HBW37504.1 DUF2273 domain-containing protein [Desulfosporosinus sp.]